MWVTLCTMESHRGSPCTNWLAQQAWWWIEVSFFSPAREPNVLLSTSTSWVLEFNYVLYNIVWILIWSWKVCLPTGTKMVLQSKHKRDSLKCNNSNLEEVLLQYEPFRWQLADFYWSTGIVLPKDVDITWCAYPRTHPQIWTCEAIVHHKVEKQSSWLVLFSTVQRFWASGSCSMGKMWARGRHRCEPGAAEIIHTIPTLIYVEVIP